MEYPDILAQSLYCAFCRSFPDSYHRFTDAFRDQMMDLSHEWLVGTHLAPLSWTRWSLHVLEPSSMRIKQEILEKGDSVTKKSSNTGPIIDFSMVEQAASLVSNSSRNTSQRGSLQLGPRTSYRPSFNRQKRISVCSNSTKNGQDKVQEVMSPITERDEKSNMGDMLSMKASKGTLQNTGLGSHIAGEGPRFQAVAFNIYGQSPLVQQHMRKQNAQRSSGADVFMQRREISKAVPLTGETYHDIVVNQFSRLKKNKKLVQKSWDSEQTQWKKFESRMLRERKDFERREQSLLGQRMEVKRLSDLLMLQQLRDADSVSALATEELEVALNAQN